MGMERSELARPKSTKLLLCVYLIFPHRHSSPSFNKFGAVVRQAHASHTINSIFRRRFSCDCVWIRVRAVFSSSHCRDTEQHTILKCCRNWVYSNYFGHLLFHCALFQYLNSRGKRKKSNDHYSENAFQRDKWLDHPICHRKRIVQ